MTEALRAAKSERTADRIGHRSGYHERKLITRVGVLELRVPQDQVRISSISVTPYRLPKSAGAVQPLEYRRLGYDV